MDVEAYFRSLTSELEALKDRVRNFIDDSHWLTDGEWKESVLSSALSKRLPDTIRVGRGFIISEETTSTQCDILLYKSSSPVLFREGSLVFLTPDAVLGVLEVKTTLSSRNLRESIQKLAAVGRLVESGCLLGLFSYDSEVTSENAVLKTLREESNHWNEVIEILSFGCSSFVKWWDHPPVETATSSSDSQYRRWHSYKLENMAAGYFLTNVINYLCPEWFWLNNCLLYPGLGKEKYKTEDIAFREERTS